MSPGHHRDSITPACIVRMSRPPRVQNVSQIDGQRVNRDLADFHSYYMERFTCREGFNHYGESKDRYRNVVKVLITLK